MRVIILGSLSILVLSFVACNQGGGGSGSSDPNVSPSGRIYPQVNSVGKFERLKDVNSSDQSRHGCREKTSDVVEIDPRIQVGKYFVISERQNWSNGSKNNVKWFGAVTKKTSKEFNFLQVIKETEGRTTAKAGDEFQNVCEVQKDKTGNGTNNREVIGCSQRRSKNSRIANSEPGPLQPYQFCMIKGNVFGRGDSFLQSSDGKFQLKGSTPTSAKKTLEAQAYGSIDRGIIECDGKEMGKGSIVTVGIRTADEPSIIRPNYSRTQCGSTLFWSQTTKLDSGTVLNETSEEVLDIDPL